MCDYICSMGDIPSLIVFANVANDVRFFFRMGEELNETRVVHGSLFFIFGFS